MKQLTPLWLLGFVCVFAMNCREIMTDRAVLLVPLGQVAPEVLDSVSAAITEEFGTEATINPPVSLPNLAFVNEKTPRYRADSLLIFLKDFLKKEPFAHVMGVTSVDISTTKRTVLGDIKEPVSLYHDWGVFGLGQRPGQISVISTYRLQRQHPHFFSRIKKVAVHELGHNLGLRHCVETENCVMRDAAESINTINQVEKELCHLCKRKVEI